MRRARHKRSSSAQSAAIQPVEALNAWLAARRRAIAIAIVVIAIGIRVVYYTQVSATPVVRLQQAPETDMSYYDAWARQIAAGDWLSRRVAVPSHRWHRDVARTYRATHDVPALGPNDSPPEERQDATQWAAWMHLPTFYQDPLYAYVVASVYRLTADRVHGVFLVQLLAGVVSVWLIWTIGWRAFDDLVALVAALLALGCAPLVFYEMLLLRDSLLVCAGLLITWLLLLPATRERASVAGLLGLVIGVGALMKSTLLLFGMVALAGMIWNRWRPRQVGIVAVGIAVGCAPLPARNLAVGEPPLTLAASGPLTFVSANEASYPPDVGFGVQPAVLAHFLGDTRGTWTDAVRLVAASQTVPGYFAQLWDKWTRAWQWYEIPNNENFYYVERLAPVLRWLPVTAWGLAPLGLIGLVMAAPQLPRRWPLFAAVLATLVPLLLFYVLGRFRIALIASVIPFAAFTIVDTSRRLAHRRYAAALVVSAAVLVVGAWTGQPLGPHERLLRPSDWILPFSALYEVPIETAAGGRQFQRAAQLYTEYFTRYEPSDRDARADLGLEAELANMHRQCADLFDAAGDHDSAAAQRRLADRLTDR